MALGIESNSIAPQLIQNSGAALVQGIRQIGQQISGHLTEMQTKRDLGALAQEMQGLNVQSNEFPIQLAQLTGRHPLAAKDDRAKMLLTPLGAAHAAWQAGEAEARAFNRAMAMQTRRRLDARAEFDYEETARGKRAVNVPGVGLVQPNEIDEVTGQAKVLTPAPVRGSTALPFASTPSGILDKRTGAVTPAPARGMTAYQQAQLRRAERKDRISAINSEINQFDSDIASAIRQYEGSFKREQDATEGTEKLRHQADKTEIGKVADQLKAEKAKRLDMLRKLREEDAVDAAIREDEAAAVSGEVLPAVPPTTELPILTPAQALTQPPGTQFRDKYGNVRTVPAK